MGANDPQRTTTEPMSDVLVAAVTAEVGDTLLDRTGGGLLANPVIASQFLGRDRFSGALAAKAVQVAWGADKFVATAEGTDFTVYDLASDSATVTPARMGFARQRSDMARSLDNLGVLDMARYARDFTIGFQQTAVSTFAALATSAGLSGGNSGGSATWGHIVADYNTLRNNNVAGPIVAVLRNSDWGSVSTDAYQLGGYAPMDAGSPNGTSLQANGFQGMFMNGNLWVYTSDECPTSGGDTVGMMFGAQFMRWNAHMPLPSRATLPIIWTPIFGVEVDRLSLKSEDYIVGSTHLGASVNIANAGISLAFAT